MIAHLADETENYHLSNSLRVYPMGLYLRAAGWGLVWGQPGPAKSLYQPARNSPHWAGVHSPDGGSGPQWHDGPIVGNGAPGGSAGGPFSG